MTEQKRELIRNLVESNADNAAEEITTRVLCVGLRFGWSKEEMLLVATLCCDVRKDAIAKAMEEARIAMESAL